MASDANNYIWIADSLKVLIPAGVAYWFGRRQYLLKRDHDQITRRYLENGIDVIIENIEHVLGVFRENYACSLRILKTFRGKFVAGIILSPDDYSPNRFLRYKQEFFYSAPFYKLRQLCGPEASVFHDETQRLFAFVESATNFFEYDLCVALKERAENRITVEAEVLVADYMAKVREYDQKSQRFYGLINELQKIAFILESNPIRYHDLKTFREKEDVRSSLEIVRNIFDKEG